MTTFSDLKDAFDLDEEWTVRFTADEHRAREMAGQYRQIGFEVKVLPLFPEGEEIDVDEEDVEALLADLDDPVEQLELESEGCTTCLDETFLVVTKGQQDGGDEIGQELFG